MCNTNCNNKPCCCEEDLLCCMPVVHCCGGYSEHNNCCPHDRCCNHPICGQCCDPCGKCDQPMCCCCYKLKKAFDEFKDETKASVTSVEGRLERLEVKEGDDYIYLLGQITNLAQKEQDDVDRLDGKIDTETNRAKQQEDYINGHAFFDAEYVNNNGDAKIIFKNKAGEQVDYIDARQFIVDGMVDNVYLEPNHQSGNTDLVITFNTYSGKSPIRIDIGDLFETEDYYNKNYINNNYYTKGSIDGTVSNLNGSIQDHIGDTTKHITAAERTQWNAAEPNVQADWTESNSSSDAFIKNKPTLGTASAKDVPASGNASTTQVVMGNDTRLTDARTPLAHTHTVSDITNFPSAASQNVTYGGDSVTIQNVINDLASRISALEGKQYWTRSNGDLTPTTSTDTVTACAFYDSSVS